MMDGMGPVLVASEDIQAKVRELGERITQDYREDKLLLVGILRGAVVFLSDLMRHLELPCEIDFMDISSYGTGTQTSGVVRILKDLEEDITGRHVLIIEDIIDTGLTLPQAGGPEREVPRLRGSRRVRHRLRHRLRWSLPQSPRHPRPQARSRQLL